MDGPLGNKRDEARVAAALVIARRLRESPQFGARGDHSTFSALGIDVAARAPRGSPLAPSRMQRALLCVRPLGVLSRQVSVDDQVPLKSNLSRQSTAETCAPDSDEEQLREVVAEPAEEVVPENALGSDFVQVRDAMLRLRPASPKGSGGGASASPPASGGGEAIPPSPPPSPGSSADLRRAAQGLLNKICPENVAAIAEKFKGLEVRTAQDLETVIELIFKKAVTEPHYSETYADLVFALKPVFPEFAPPEGGRPISFKSAVLNICQNAFEAFLQVGRGEPGAPSTQGDTDVERKARKDRMRANMRFVGNLYLRNLLSSKVVGAIGRELVHGDVPEQLPQEHALECGCELLSAIGFTLDSAVGGQEVVTQICSRLLELKAVRAADGRAAYSKRVQFMIQDLLDTRAAGWAKKLFTCRAKTKEEIRLEQQRDLHAKAVGSETPGSENVVLGRRPNWLTPVAAC